MCLTRCLLWRRPRSRMGGVVVMRTVGTMCMMCVMCVLCGIRVPTANGVRSRRRRRQFIWGLCGYK